MVVARPFKVGDKIDVKGVAGTVEQVKLFTTTIRTDDGKIALVPNSDITSNVIKVKQ